MQGDWRKRNAPAVNYELFVGKKMPLEEYNKFQAEQAK